MITKDFQLSAVEFLQLMLDKDATLPCGGEEPNFDWIDDLPSPEHAHDELLQIKAQIRQYKRDALTRAFTNNRAFSQEELMNGSFLKKWDMNEISQPVKEKLLQRAIQTRTILDLQAANYKQHHLFQQSSKDETEALETIYASIVSPALVDTHFGGLWKYCQALYPMPQIFQENWVFMEGSDGTAVTKRTLQLEHKRVQATLLPLLEEFSVILAKETIGYGDLINSKYPMEKENSYHSLAYSPRYNPDW